MQMLQEVLEQGGDGGAGKLLESARRAARRGAELTHKLLTFARKQSLAPAAIELPDALGALTDMLQRTLGEAIRIDWQVAPGCPPCRADPSQLDNAIVNLALNARDAMPGGGRLRLTAAPLTIGDGASSLAEELDAGEYVVVSVSDTGQGMSPEVLRHAYEPFFTTKPSGKGSGLGLSMVYGFVKQSGGTVRIHSEPGRGTEVRLYFPADERRADSVEPADAAAPPAAAGRQQTILLVDDDSDVLEVTATQLRRAGYRVLTAADTAAALQWLAGAEPIALLFTDVVLGGGETGTRLAVEALKLRPRLPVLFTSGFAEGSLRVADVPPAQFLAKPYQGEQLIAHVAALLGQPGNAAERPGA